MQPFAINHMTLRHHSMAQLFDVASSLGCAGVELRTDVDHPLFDGQPPEAARDAAAAAGLRIFAVAEVYGFNHDTAAKLDQIKDLAALAKRAGAEGIVLIPLKADAPVDRAAQQAALGPALELITPVLEAAGLRGLIEPLGFENSSLRYKADVVAALRNMGVDDHFAIIHDSFHHCLAGEDEMFARETRLVHISGIPASSTARLALQDDDRGLIGANDRLGNLSQITQLRGLGYFGPLSVEAFAPQVHQMTDPAAALQRSFGFITSQLAQAAA